MRQTTRYHAVSCGPRDITRCMSVTQCARDRLSGCAILLLPSTLCDGHHEITQCEADHDISRSVRWTVRYPSHSVLGTTCQVVPFYYSQAHCVTDIVRSHGARRTARSHVVRDISVSVTECARDHLSEYALLLLPSTLCDGHREITW